MIKSRIIGYKKAMVLLLSGKMRTFAHVALVLW